MPVNDLLFTAGDWSWWTIILPPILVILITAFSWRWFKPFQKWLCAIVAVVSIVTAAWAADTKLSALTELAATPAASDEFYINDGGTSKKIQYSNLMDGGALQADSVDSAQYAAGSIDAEHLAADIIDETKIADDGIDSEHYNDGSIDAVHLAADIIDETKIADNGIDSEHYNDGSIDAEHLAADVIDETKIADNGIDSEHYNDNSIDSEHISTIVDSIYWPAAAISTDGTQCADPAQATINSGPEIYTIICADNDASQMEGHVNMPDSWNAGTVTFSLEYIQTAADTDALNADVSCACRGAGETVNNTFGTEVAIDDAGVTGSNAIDQTDSAAVTCNGTCAAGDSLFWRIELDATGTTTAVATLHFVGVKLEYTSDVGD